MCVCIGVSALVKRYNIFLEFHILKLIIVATHQERNLVSPEGGFYFFLTSFSII